MYSRSMGRDGRWYESDDGYDDGELDEYELYRYNLPPRYDGSRFGSSRHFTSKRSTSSTAKEADTRGDEGDMDVSTQGDDLQGPCEGEWEVSAPPTALPRECGERHSLLPEIGSEELLIITLILILSAENELDLGTVLMLLVLLTVR